MAAEIIAEAQKHVLHGTGKERELLWRTSLCTSLSAGVSVAMSERWWRERAL